jgi:hypothetical protein
MASSLKKTDAEVRTASLGAGDMEEGSSERWSTIRSCCSLNGRSSLLHSAFRKGDCLLGDNIVLSSTWMSGSLHSPQDQRVT